MHHDNRGIQGQWAEELPRWEDKASSRYACEERHKNSRQDNAVPDQGQGIDVDELAQSTGKAPNQDNKMHPEVVHPDG